MYDGMILTGFKYSTPANFALSLTDALQIDDGVKLSYHVRYGGGGEENLKEFAAALRDFSIKSNFHDFYVSNEEYYRDNTYRVATLLGDWDYASELQDYYGMEYESFNIIHVPLFLTHEVAHLSIMSDYSDLRPVTESGNYLEKLDAICFYEGFTHLLAHEKHHAQG